MTPIVLRSGDLNHNELDTALDIAIIGAGVAGLTCARQLQLAGYRVALIDKSRGLGGRLATRRLPGETHADHGVCYLQPKHPAFAELLQELAQSGILSVWPARHYGLSAEGALVLEPKENTASAPCYASETGITALAKALAIGLRIERGQRAIALELDTRSAFASWRVTAESGRVFTAQQLVIAIPAPQAIALLETLPDFANFDPDCLAQLRSVRFSRCLGAIATYSPSLQSRAAQIPWQGIHCTGHATLAWIGLDSSKQLHPQSPVIVVQSNAEFGEAQFEQAGFESAGAGTSDRSSVVQQSVGQQLLTQAAVVTGEDWLAAPEVLQVHRWGYAFALSPIVARSLSAQMAAPLWFTGDWCSGNRVESAFLSGRATAEVIASHS